MYQRRSTPSAGAGLSISPFLSEGSSTSFGSGFNLAAGSSLHNNKYAPSTPFQRAAGGTNASVGASPFEPSPRSPGSPTTGLQSPAPAAWNNQSWAAPAVSFAAQPAPAVYSNYAPASSPPPTAHLRTPSNYSAPTASSRSVSSSNLSHASLTAAQPLPAASTARFSHPDLERISGQLHQTSEKSPVHLLVYSAALVGAIVTALFLLYLPLSAREPVRLGFLSVSQPIFYLSGFAFVFASLIFSVRGLNWYNSLQAPRKDMEQLSERQMRLMGWSDDQISGAREHGRRSRMDEEEERLQDRNASRARARVQQLTGVAAAAARVPQPKLAASSARVLSPSASLRFLHSSTPSTRLNAAELSPFRSRGLDSSLSPAGASRIHDEAGLSSFVREYDQQRTQKLAQGSGDHGQSTPVSSSFANPFSTPSPGRSMGTSPRGGFGSGGLFGFGASASAASHTPPYQTSLRETAAVQKSAASLALSTAANASLNAGGPNAVSTFSFNLPNHRFALDDPRSDSDLHDSFHLQLKTQLRTTANVVDQWARNMRTWIVQQILRPQLQQLDVSNAALGRFANFILQQPGVGQAFTENELALMRELGQAFAVQQSTPPLLSARHEECVSLLITRFPARPEVIARVAIEKYLSVDEKATTAPAAAGAAAAAVSAATRAYVAQRLQTLCAPGDDALSKYNLGANAAVPPVIAPHLRTNPSAGLFGTRTMFNAASGPSASSAAVSSSNLPSDADVILHAFCTFLSHVQSNFRQQFVKSFNQNTLTHAQLPASTHAAHSRATAATSGGAESCAMAQVRAPSLAPYFVVTHSSSGPGGVRREAVKLVTEPGRASLFQAMVLWILDLPRGSPLLREFAGVIA